MSFEMSRAIPIGNVHSARMKTLLPLKYRAHSGVHLYCVQDRAEALTSDGNTVQDKIFETDCT